MMRRRKRLLVIGALLAAGCVVAGIAWAAIPYNGVITGCYTKSGGTLRVTDTQSSNCTSKETRLDWNVQGAPGVDGAKGADGAAGTNGAPGPVGPTEGVNSQWNFYGPQPPNPLVPYRGTTGEGTYIDQTVSKFTTTKSGKLFLSKPFSGYFTCAGTNWYWIQLDQSIVAGSLVPGKANGPDNPLTITLVGVTDTVIPAGEHTMQIAGMCKNETPTGAGVTPPWGSGTAIVLGG